MKGQVHQIMNMFFFLMIVWFFISLLENLLLPQSLNKSLLEVVLSQSFLSLTYYTKKY